MYTSADVGKMVRRTRLGLNVTQENLAMASGIGVGFIKDLEKGKPTCEMEKVLRILGTLGIQMTLHSPIPNSEVRPDSEQERASGKRTRRIPSPESRR